MPKKGRVTLKQVAEHAGVSRSTASLIIRDSPNISEATRKKVLKSMEELGYIYDRVAANLRAQSSTTVGLIITDIANPFYAELLEGVHKKLETESYTVLLGATYDSGKKQKKLLSTMIEHRVGGIILCPVSRSSYDELKSVLNWDIPIVTAVREIPKLNLDYVGINYVEGARRAVEYLISKGHEKIAFLGGFPESSAWQQRRLGFEQAHKQAGLNINESFMITSPAEQQGGVDSVEKLLKLDQIPTAIFCFNDLVAFGVVQGLRKVGLEPGKDVSVVGFDNVKESETLSYPPLTTINSKAHLIGSQAADLLFQRLKGNESEQRKIILEPELIIRSST